MSDYSCRLIQIVLEVDCDQSNGVGGEYSRFEEEG